MEDEIQGIQGTIQSTCITIHRACSICKICFCRELDSLHAGHHVDSGEYRLKWVNSDGWRFGTQAALFWTCWIAILLSHLRFSYPAIISRGHPPLDPDDMLRLFVAPFFVGFPAIFGSREIRYWGVAFGALGFSLIYALAIINLNDTRPSIGHSEGILGIIRTYDIGFVVLSLVLFVPIVIVTHFVERVLGDSLRLFVHGLHGSDGEVNEETDR